MANPEWLAPFAALGIQDIIVLDTEFLGRSGIGEAKQRKSKVPNRCVPSLLSSLEDGGLHHMDQVTKEQSREKILSALRRLPPLVPADGGRCAIPVMLCALSLVTGKEWHVRLLPFRKIPCPLPLGQEVLYLGYSLTAEWSVFLAMEWPLPLNIIDLYAERMMETSTQEPRR
jgi:hypothetical protein